MQHKVFEQYLRLGSLADKDRECEHFGFSLAEMLIVLLIMSFIAISIPLIHFKKTELKTKRSLHGRFECFYDEAGNLMQYSKNEDGATLRPLEGVTECVFTPPRNAAFFMVHAVGGGTGLYRGGEIRHPDPQILGAEVDRSHGPARSALPDGDGQHVRGIQSRFSGTDEPDSEWNLPDYPGAGAPAGEITGETGRRGQNFS